MHITFVTIFPDIYTSFLQTSLIKKSQEKDILTFSLVNPRDFCDDKHKRIDDEIYGGGAGMLMKAKPVIDAVESVVASFQKKDSMRPISYKIIYLSPSKTIFTQSLAYEYSHMDNIVFISGRYEGIDYRFEEYMQKKYPDIFQKLSVGQFVTLGGELPSMVVTEAITRLIPGVIKEEASHLIESYDPQQAMNNVEFPQYTRPEDVEGLKVPDVLLSGHHAEIERWRKENTFIA